MAKQCEVCGVSVGASNKTCSLFCRSVRTKRMNIAARRTLATPAAVEGARWIPLTKGTFVLVDDELYEPLMEHVWYLQESGDGYAARRVRTPEAIVYLHRVVICAPVDREVDHVNRNTLDCRRRNLRLTTSSGGNANRGKHDRLDARSSFKGVSQPKDYRKWVALITVNGRTRRLGTFPTEIEAAQAYDVAARLHFGEFADLNF